jgi:hypothetical protein
MIKLDVAEENWKKSHEDLGSKYKYMIRKLKFSYKCAWKKFFAVGKIL